MPRIPPRWGSRWTALLIGLSLVACGVDETPSTPSVPAATPAPTTPASLPSGADEAALLDAAYRIDVQRVEAVFDVFPAERRVQVRAATTFRMRPGQTRPIVHFEPAREEGTTLRLDGQELSPRAERDVRFLSFGGSGQVSVELQRDLPPDVSHRLDASYSLPMSDSFGRFFTDVSDIQGRGNEGLLPTLNTPHELARHILILRVHTTEPYQGVGSGLFYRTDATDVQEWVLDTEREVASYTVFFYVVPARDVRVVERRVQQVDVRVVSFLGGPDPQAAYDQLDPWLAELGSTLGPFPMPRGLGIVLTPTGGGMEYYGATITSLRALRHEIFHMYYGCSTVAKTYRDSWWDEAIDMWYELSADPAFPPIADGYRSGIVGARSPVTVGFDRRAYDEGARIFQAVAVEIGGRGPTVDFLRHLHRTRSFDPFNTRDLVEELRIFSGADFHERFQAWLYSREEAAATRAESAYAWLHRVDTLPPETIRRRYER